MQLLVQLYSAACVFLCLLLCVCLCVCLYLCELSAVPVTTYLENLEKSGKI